jgi:hypothetical protein
MWLRNRTVSLAGANGAAVTAASFAFRAKLERSSCVMDACVVVVEIVVTVIVTVTVIL